MRDGVRVGVSTSLRTLQWGNVREFGGCCWFALGIQLASKGRLCMGALEVGEREMLRICQKAVPDGTVSSSDSLGTWTGSCQLVSVQTSFCAWRGNGRQDVHGTDCGHQTWTVPDGSTWGGLEKKSHSTLRYSGNAAAYLQCVCYDLNFCTSCCSLC